ncbi:LysR substrate-binding domain-containing protein [Brevundimonas sp. M20]|uniref:LysR substrate-binding domain-containing protein n=1 Tax=Brevundimonas sp. M20 TaxID=2591463 RepID=UPI001F1006BC|nr:LysR substrate-binding domain-containing protein [Brevundimonas sp. M20]
MFENLTPRSGLPSLNGLRAFEAMGRTGSATRAAQELNVTHSAVSRQVKALEAALGVRLFEGPKHGLRLTEQGRTLLAGLTEGFDKLAAAVGRIRERRELRLAVHPSLAVKWLVPRLADLESRHPEIVLHITELENRALKQRGADLALRHVDAAMRDTPGLEVLAENRVGPVCAPALAASIMTSTRLITRTREIAWAEWSELSGQAQPGGRSRVLPHQHVVLDAALAGLGAAVLPWMIVADDIAAGRLVAPFGFVPNDGALALIRNGGEPDSAERTLMRWLKDQARATHA